jgi:fatty-acyl-CoA synthase
MAAFFGVGALIIVLLASVATTLRFINYETGFDFIALRVAPASAALGVGFGFIGFLMSIAKRKKSPVALSVIGLVAGAATLAGAIRLWMVEQSTPPIHDVSTNWDDPLPFSKEMMAVRDEAYALPIEDNPRVPTSAGPPWGGTRVAEVNAKTCPGAKPIMHDVDADKVAAAIKAAGYAVTGEADFRVEGTHTGFFFGESQDVAVRIRPDRTDVRSVSRTAQSDLGANCRGVTRIVQALSR